MSIMALREQRAALTDELKALVENPQWSAERDQPIYDQKMAEVGDIEKRIENHQRMNELAAKQASNEQAIDAADRVAHDKRDPASAMFAKLLRGGDRALNAEEWGEYRNTMSTTTDSEGGFTVPDLLGGEIIDSLKAFGGMREVATVLRTADGAPLNYPTSDGTSEVGEILAENAAATDADAVFGTVPVATLVGGWELPSGSRLDTAIRYAYAEAEEAWFSRWTPSVVLRRPMTDRWEVHAEYFDSLTQGLVTDTRRGFFSPGTHIPLTDRLEVGVRVGPDLGEQLLAGEQEAAVKRAMHLAGFRMAARLQRGDWAILWLRRRRRAR
jgi:hypothetical protein